MEETAVKALGALGRGFDLTSDFRLRFAKAARLVEVDQANVRDVAVPGGPTVSGVSVDVRCDKGDRLRYRSDVLDFNQMSELLNQKSSIQGKVPSGYFNAVFEFSRLWFEDAGDTKHLALDGYFISLCTFHLTASPLILLEEVKKSVPHNWDPALLSRFINTYGTHIIVGMALGGQDVICVRQRPSSAIPPAELKGHLEDLGDYLFSDGKNLSPLHRRARDGKHKVPGVFLDSLNANDMQLPSFSAEKEGIKIVFSKRGGNPSSRNHHIWLQTVLANPDVISFKFVPITSLLTGIPGSGYLSHAINLYLRYKPLPEDLQYFLEFQIPRQWAPMFNELPLGPQRRKPFSTAALRFSFMGPKLHVNASQVSSESKPIVGMRLYLEGKKCNQLAAHIQHLSSLPSMVESLAKVPSAKVPSWWRGSDEVLGDHLVPVRWRKYSRVCTATVESNPEWNSGEANGVFIVTGVQLFTKGKWGKSVLHLRLLFTFLPNCTILKDEWADAPGAPHKSSFLTNISTALLQRGDATVAAKQQTPVINSGVYPDGPPVPVHSQKLLKFVDTAEVVRGPHHLPGHWLVTAAKLVMEDHKIGLSVHFSLLDYTSTVECI